MKLLSSFIILTVSISCPVLFANEYSYVDIAKRHTGSSLSQEALKAAKMQGECLVGVKALNFKKKKEFDRVAEWTSYRTVSLLEQYSPCEVLIIMEVAQALHH